MTDPDNAPENTDPKKSDDTAEQPTAAREESDGTELVDEELGDAAGGQPGAADNNPIFGSHQGTGDPGNSVDPFIGD